MDYLKWFNFITFIYAVQSNVWTSATLFGTGDSSQEKLFVEGLLVNWVTLNCSEQNPVL